MKGRAILLFWLTIITTVDFVNGDLVEGLYRKYHQHLYGIIIDKVHCKEDAEDILQSVFINVWRNSKRFKELDENQTISLLVKYSRNLTIDFIRKAESRIKPVSMTMSDDDSEPLKEFDIPDNTQNPETIVLEKDQLKKLASYVGCLPDEQRDVIELKYGCNMSNTEISDFLNISVEAVNSRIYRAKQSLKKMKGNGEE